MLRRPARCKHCYAADALMLAITPNSPALSFRCVSSSFPTSGRLFLRPTSQTRAICLSVQ